MRAQTDQTAADNGTGYPPDDPARRRKARLAQAKHRGTRQSIKTELEDVLLLLAWEAEQLSEGQMAGLLDMDRITPRKKRLDAIDTAMWLAEAMDAGRADERRRERERLMGGVL